MGLLDRIRGTGDTATRPPSAAGAGASLLSETATPKFPTRAASPAPFPPAVSHLTDSAFLALDFETATAQRGSACALGFALFDGGELKGRGATLIDPGIDENEWNGFNVTIHGIRPRDVVGAPSFSDVWTELQSRYSGVPLVAHNASFDMSVLRAEFVRADLRPEVPLRYTCSASMSRAAWPEMLSVSLPVVAQDLGIDLDHHDPGSDAHASGQILLRAIDALDASDVNDALTKAHRTWAEINPDLTWKNGWLGGGLRAKDYAPGDDAEFDVEHPLFGKTLVFTGTLHSMTRREAFQAIANVGALPADGVTKHTNVLVVGEQDLARLAAGETMSAKQRKAAEMRRRGQDVQLIGEIDFLRML